jgi:hypothetical protein
MKSLTKRQIEYHKSYMEWHALAIEAHEKGLPEKLIYRHKPPINVFSRINIYTKMLNKELKAFLDRKSSPFEMH